MTKKQKGEAAPVIEELGIQTTIPLDQLDVSDLNARKAGADSNLDELIASIASVGLLQPLIAYFDPQSGRGQVCGGQRRLLALQALAKDGRLSWTVDVPVRHMAQDDALEASLAENLERKDMTPGDEYRAFKALLDTGRFSEQMIADRFGYTLQHVTRRMKLAELEPTILAALDSGKIGVEAAMSYAAATTHEQQLKIFNAQERAAYDKHKPSSIRQAINAAGLDANGPIGKFIGGAKAYEAAGGVFETSDFDDLFSLDYGGKRKQVMSDGSIVKKLWSAATDKAAKKLVKKAADHFGVKIEGVLFPDKPAADASPKPPKEYFKLEYDEYSYGGGMKEGEFTSILEEARAAGARFYAIGTLAGYNPLEASFSKRKLFLSKDAKPIVDRRLSMKDEQRAEEQAKREREQQEARVIERAAWLYFKSLEPTAKLALITIDRGWMRDNSTHFSLGMDIDHADGTDFLDAARAELEAEAAERARLKAEADAAREAEAKAEAERLAAFNEAHNALADSEGEGVEVIVMSGHDDDGEEGEIIATRHSTDAGIWRVRYTGPFSNEVDDDEELGFDTVMGLISDYADTVHQPTLKTYATTADHEAAVIGEATTEEAKEPEDA